MQGIQTQKKSQQIQHQNNAALTSGIPEPTFLTPANAYLVTICAAKQHILVDHSCASFIP
eukprot:8515271-Karenia_brevis.AAC.1